MLAISLGMAAPLTSCSDNDDKPAAPAAKSVEGIYTGDMTCTVMGSESTFEDMTFTVTATDDATVSVAIPSFGNPPMQVPQVTVAGVRVSGEEGSYTLATTEFNGTTDGGKTYSGTLQGSAAEKAVTIEFSLQYGAMPMPMICRFTSSAK